MYVGKCVNEYSYNKEERGYNYPNPEISLWICGKERKGK